jgi:hypothetical protein
VHGIDRQGHGEVRLAHTWRAQEDHVTGVVDMTAYSYSLVPFVMRLTMYLSTRLACSLYPALQARWRASLSWCRPTLLS